MQGSRKDRVPAGMLPGTLCGRVCSRGALPELCVTRALGSCSAASGCAWIHEPELSRGGKFASWIRRGILLNKLQPKGHLLLMKFEGKFLLEGIS